MGGLLQAKLSLVPRPASLIPCRLCNKKLAGEELGNEAMARTVFGYNGMGLGKGLAKLTYLPSVEQWFSLVPQFPFRQHVCCHSNMFVVTAKCLVAIATYAPSSDILFAWLSRHR